MFAGVVCVHGRSAQSLLVLRHTDTSRVYVSDLLLTLAISDLSTASREADYGTQTYVVSSDGVDKLMPSTEAFQGLHIRLCILHAILVLYACILSCASDTISIT